MTRICIVQLPPHILDLDSGTEAAVRHITEAAALGADLAVFPETWLGGSPNALSRQAPQPRATTCRPCAKPPPPTTST